VKKGIGLVLKLTFWLLKYDFDFNCWIFAGCLTLDTKCSFNCGRYNKRAD